MARGDDTAHLDQSCLADDAEQISEGLGSVYGHENGFMVLTMS